MVAVEVLQELERVEMVEIQIAPHQHLQQVMVLAEAEAQPLTVDKQVEQVHKAFFTY
jgi:hypothetical protein